MCFLHLSICHFHSFGDVCYIAEDDFDARDTTANINSHINILCLPSKGKNRKPQKEKGGEDGKYC